VTIPEFEEFESNDKLLDQIASLQKKLEKERDRTDALLQMMVRTIRDVQPPTPWPVPPIKNDTRRAGAETAIVLASDWQLSKITPDYNTKVGRKRIRLFGDKISGITNIQRADHPVKNCRLYLAGDILEGEEIFPGQMHLIDAGLYEQVLHHAPRAICDLIYSLLNTFEKVHVVGVIGNHGRVGGRSSRLHDPRTNADRMAYKVAQYMLMGDPDYGLTEIGKSNRVTWSIPGDLEEIPDRYWFAVDYIGDWGFLMAHGDQIRGGFGGFPFYGYAKKAWGWIDSIPQPWDYLLTGHWHQPTSLTLNQRQVRINGSTESRNSYAQENLAAVGTPTQWLAYCHPKNGITAEYWVDLSDGRTPQKRRPTDLWPNTKDTQ